MGVRMLVNTRLLLLQYTTSQYGTTCCKCSHLFHNQLRCFSTKKPGEEELITKQADSASGSEKSKEKPVVADWIKKISKEDFFNESPMNYRRQNYPDPLYRACGILADDLRILFSNITFDMRRIYKFLTKSNMPSKTSTDLKFPFKHDNSVSNQKVENKSTDHLTLTINNEKHQNQSSETPTAVEEKKQKKTGMFSNFGLNRREEKVWPSYCDVIIIGGGAMGSSIAYHLQREVMEGLDIVMVEKDSTYKESSTVLSVGGIRQQFSLPENIMLSLYGMKFLRDMHRLLEIDDTPPPSVNFQPHGYLTLASEQGLHQLKENLYVQQYCNAKVQYLEPREIKERFPWMSTDGIAGGVLGLENEGWFDPWTLLTGLRRKAVDLGVQCVEGEVVGLEFGDIGQHLFTDTHPTTSEKRIRTVKVRVPDGSVRDIKTAIVILAAGHSTGKICYDMLGIGKAESGLMAYPVPIEPRKRYVYSFHAPKGPGLSTPLVIDPCGAYFRREGLGNMFLAGLSPPAHEEPSCDNLEVDMDFFMDKLWPVLANRVKSFEEIKVQGSWAGFYEYNIFDQNGIIGKHPIVSNMILAAGFSGHGIQHALGVGRAVTELMLMARYDTIDLSRFQYERVYLDYPVYEAGIV